MPFSDPVVGGNVLIRDAIRSPNYVAGVSGWIINADGTSEFNSSTLRGVLEIGFSPNPRISAGGSGTIPAALANFSADFVWSAAIILWFNGTDFYFWAIGTYVGGGGPFPVESKGTYDTTNNVLFHEIVQKSSINFILFGSAVYNSQPANWVYRNGAVTFNDDCEFYTGVNSSRRGYEGAFFTVAGTVATSVGAEIAITAWDALSSAFATLRDGYLYEVIVTYGIFNSTAGASPQIATVRLRQDINSTAATLLGTSVDETPGQASRVMTHERSFMICNTSGATVLATFGLTIQRQVGAGTHGLYGDATIPLSIRVEHAGRIIDAAPAQMTNYIPSVT